MKAYILLAAITLVSLSIRALFVFLVFFILTQLGVPYFLVLLVTTLVAIPLVYDVFGVAHMLIAGLYELVKLIFRG